MGRKILLGLKPMGEKNPIGFETNGGGETSQVTYVTMVPRMGNETLRPLGVTTGNALSVTCV